MYQDELYREAKLIMQGWQEWVRAFATFWTGFVARSGIEPTKSSDTELRLH